MENLRTQVWSNGGGVQSAAIAALIVMEKIRPDIALIVDTNREQSTTWTYMENVISPALLSVGMPIHKINKKKYAKVDLFGGKDGNSLLIPTFTNINGDIGKMPTFCSTEWKVRTAQRWLNEQGVKKCDMWMGISTDEMSRAKKGAGKWGKKYPLIDFRMNRTDCIALVKKMGWPEPPRSSCWMCPNHTQEEWRDIKENKPDDYKKAVFFDKYIRTKDKNVFLHSDGVPFDEVDLSDKNGVLFNHCDSGMCFT